MENEDGLTPEERTEENEVNTKGYLTNKQEMFCREYLTDFNATQAALRAGYAKASAEMQGSRLLSKDKVRARVDELIAERAETLEVTQGWVVKNLKKVAARCLQEIRPFTDSKGNQIVDDKGNPLFVFDTRGANQALELLGKHTGAFKMSDVPPGITLIQMGTMSEKVITEPKPRTPDEEKVYQEKRALALTPKHAPAPESPPQVSEK